MSDLTFKKRLTWKTAFNIVVYAFALAGFAIIGAWAFYQLGFTKNRGAVDKNYRYMLSVEEMEALQDSTFTEQQVQEQWMTQYARLAAFSKYYPVNAQLIARAAQTSNNPLIVDKMLAAASLYIQDEEYKELMQKVTALLRAEKQHEQQGNVIPWMNGVEWEALKVAIINDKDLIIQAGELTGVEPRLIVGCLIGEQIRLFNSKREQFKKYLGPVKVLSVQSQFSYGVNGIKISTAKMIEEHLRNPHSEYYMGKRYEHLLDYDSVAGKSVDDVRYERLVDYRNHLYSYLYTGCILHQTMLQWKRAGYDISNRPDVLFTLFNVGFSQSVPKANPVPGGSHIEVCGETYTFGAIGFDFYFSGELSDQFPFWRQRFIAGDKELTPEELEYIKGSVSACKRPARGWEYRQDSTAAQPAAPAYSLDDETPITFTPVIPM